jgi:polyisoprenoid-binding protein YceI
MSRLILVLAFLIAIPLHAQEYVTKNGSAVFLSKAQLNEFEGKSNQLQGLVDLNKNLLDFYLDLNTLATGIKLRDKHMRDNYLETNKYPFAEFTGEIESVPQLSTTPRKVIATGKFKIHGVEREIQVPGELKLLSDGRLELKANFVVSLDDYNIDIPKLIFFELAAEQQVSIHAILTPKK